MIRQLQSDDRARLVEMIGGIANFSAEEKSVAIELIDDALAKESGSYYNVFVYAEKKILYGYYCIGQRALTDGVYDLYWIVVNPNTQNKGIGKKLLEHAENFVKEKNGRWILAETSSKESYSATRNFYLRNKYSIVAQIEDFYSLKDNLIVFGKYIKI